MTAPRWTRIGSGMKLHVVKPDVRIVGTDHVRTLCGIAGQDGGQSRILAPQYCVKCKRALREMEGKA